jgi:N-acetylmuramoyl-L-alanine amidase
MSVSRISSLLCLAAVLLAPAAMAAAFRTVVIDPGHGGHDSGGRWGKVYEKHIALDTSLRLEKHLRKMGYRTVMTRRDDRFLTLPQRVEFANRHREAIFVSVHYNYTWKQQVQGVETFYFNQDGWNLANHVQRSMIQRTRSEDRQARFARYYVIRNCNLPSILVEGGFVSNEEERKLMKSGGFREAIARGIAEGIDRYRKAEETTKGRPTGVRG